MQLLQAKVRCIKEVTDSGWLRPGRKMTLLTGPRKEAVSEILKGLEALNPLYEIERLNPFAEHPQTWQQGEYRRQVVREKKTAVTAVFSAGPELVKVLALLDDSLIETDRIELGRRLDYSRWVSFVELSASARWSDISEKISLLKSTLDDTAGSAGVSSDAFIESCRPTDRIKGALAQECRDWLMRQSLKWTGEPYNLYRECLHAVDLHERFKLANRIIKEYLPPMVRLGPDLLLCKEYKYTDLADDNMVENDPVVLLLKRIFNRFHLARLTEEKLDRLNMKIQEVASKDMFRMAGLTLRVEEGRFLPGYSTEPMSQVDKRMMYIRLVCFLADILWAQYPFLLCDGFDKELLESARTEMACLLSAIAENTQVIFQPDNHEWGPCYIGAKEIHITGG